MQAYLRTFEKILNETYGVGSLVAPIESILWTIDRLPEDIDARLVLKKLNARRAKCGLPLCHAPFGSRAF